MSRRLIYRVHKWAGLLAGFLLIAISLTGSLLVVRKPLDRLTRPRRFFLSASPKRMSSNGLVANCQTKYPTASLVALELDSMPDEPMKLDLRDSQGSFAAFIDPYSGEILGDERRNPPLSHFSYALHANLFLGRPGAIVVTLLGAALTLLATTGLYVYRGVWRHPFRLRRGRSKRIRAVDLHRVAGLWSLLMLLILGTTGVWLDHDSLLPSEPPPATGRLAILGFQDLDRLAKTSESVLPGFRPIAIVFPSDGSDIVTFAGSLKTQHFGWLFGNYGSEVRVDGRSGLTTAVSTPASQSATDKLSTLAYPLHSGEFALGPAEWIVFTFYTIVGLTPGLLAVTGFILWRKSWRRASGQHLRMSRSSSPLTGR